MFPRTARKFGNLFLLRRGQPRGAAGRHPRLHAMCGTPVRPPGPPRPSRSVTFRPPASRSRDATENSAKGTRRLPRARSRCEEARRQAQVLGVLAIAGNESEDPLVQVPPPTSTCIDHMRAREFSSVCVPCGHWGVGCLSVSWGEQQLATHADMPRCLRLRNLLFPSHSPSGRH